MACKASHRFKRKAVMYNNQTRSQASPATAQLNNATEAYF